MPIPFLADAIFGGISSIPYAVSAFKLLPWIALVVILKLYFGGASNASERVMHSKVVLITGGTSGIGAAVTQSLATRGAQIILLTHHAPSDPFLVEYIEDLRATTKNELIYAEQVDLASLQSIRLFATKWVDNAPPRRLDLIIMCANTMTPKFGVVEVTHDNLEPNWGINYVANFHLLSILSPAIRAQPADRDVRIIIGTCSSYLGGVVESLKDNRSPLPKGKEHGGSKLATMVFAQAFQKHLDAYKRPDKQPNNARVIIVDPSYTRTPGMRRWLTMGSLWGLLLYLFLWPLWWLILKSPLQGAQSFLRAAMEAELGRGVGGRFIKECKEIDFLRKEIKDDKLAKELWSFSEKQIEALEKEGAVRRALAKKEHEAQTEMEDEKRDDKLSQTHQESGSGRVSGSRRSRKKG